LLEPRYAKVREKVGFLNGQLSNNLSGIATIKSFTAEKFETERIRGLSNAYRTSNNAAIQFSAGFVPLIRMLILGGFIAIMVFGGDLALNGTLSLGIYSTMIFMTQRLLWPLTRMGETLDLYQRAKASTSRVMDLLAIRSPIISGQKAMPAGTQPPDIAFKDVSFHYKSNKNLAVVDGFDAYIPAGTIAAFVGSTGAGKSTLVKLLLRFYDVTDGAILLGGTDVRELQLAALRGNIGLVSQDVFLFHGTVRENICYGTFEATLDEVTAAAKIAEAHEFISRLPEGYDTIVGERGIKLSGGQRQRISIARAVLKNPPVLILDEATSSVDNETEAAIQRSLERIAVGRTTILIAHRLSTVRNADQIFVLADGRLQEQGKHEDLVGKNAGIYHNLWLVQTGEKNID
jgi:ATP-binding cassette subfamily B protein